MGTAPRTEPDQESETLRDEWLGRLASLVNDVDTWAGEVGWRTRRIEKTMKDSQVGSYKAPGLLIQKEFTELLLEPIARSAPGAEGVVDLYAMPAYDDIASLYFHDGSWTLHYMFPGQATVATMKEAEARPFTKDALRDVLGAMSLNGG